MHLRTALSAALFTLATLLTAQAADLKTLSTSPDGRIVIVKTDLADQPPAALIDKATGKILRPLIQNGDSSTIGTILWKPDSTRVAVVESTGRFDYGLFVYTRQGDAFESIELPSLPEAKIPDKYGPDTKLKHWSSLSTPRPVRWEKDGSLVVELATSADDTHTQVTAIRTIVIAFPADKKARITNATLKIKIDKL